MATKTPEEAEKINHEMDVVVSAFREVGFTLSEMHVHYFKRYANAAVDLTDKWGEEAYSFIADEAFRALLKGDDVESFVAWMEREVERADQG